MSEDNGADKLTPCPKSPTVYRAGQRGANGLIPRQRRNPVAAAADCARGISRHPHRGAGSGLPSRRGQNPLLRFVDDLEFQYSPDEDVIHMRSASRLGYSDFGTNRKRLESIRERLEEKS